MAKNEQNKPENIKTGPENEAPAQEQTTPIETVEGSGNTPAPEMTAEEAAILAHEGEAALQEMGEGQLEPPTPFDFGGKHMPCLRRGLSSGHKPGVLL